MQLGMNLEKYRGDIAPKDFKKIVNTARRGVAGDIGIVSAGVVGGVEMLGGLGGVVKNAADVWNGPDQYASVINGNTLQMAKEGLLFPIELVATHPLIGVIGLICGFMAYRGLVKSGVQYEVGRIRQEEEAIESNSRRGINARGSSVTL